MLAPAILAAGFGAHILLDDQARGLHCNLVGGQAVTAFDMPARSILLLLCSAEHVALGVGEVLRLGCCLCQAQGLWEPFGSLAS